MEAHSLAQELAVSNARVGQPSSYTTSTIEALMTLNQFPIIFRSSFSDLLEALPLTISVGEPSTRDPVSPNSDTDLTSTRYAHYCCIHRSPSGKQCSTWTLIPYVADTFFRGLARVLAVSANLRVTGGDLETELSTGFRSMLCNGHDEKTKDAHADSLAGTSRRIIEQWRVNEQKWRYEGKKACQQPLYSNSMNGTTRMAMERRLGQMSLEISRLQDVNHGLSHELRTFGGQYRHEH